MTTHAEQAVLGAVLIDSACMEKITDIVTPQDFACEPEGMEPGWHGVLFSHMLRLSDDDIECDVVSLSHSLAEAGIPPNLGYLAEMAHNTPSASNVVAYAKQVKESAETRRIARLGSTITEIALMPGSAKDKQAQVYEAVERLDSVSVKEEHKDIEQLSKELVERIEHRFNNGTAITGVPSGYTDLDAMTSGLQPSDLIIVAARPSMGKTTFAMNLVQNAAINQDKFTVVFSLEMPSDQIMDRLTASIGKIELDKVRKGLLKEDDWPKLSTAVTKLKSAKLDINDKAGITPGEMRQHLKKMQRKGHEIGMVMVDYLQLMRLPSKSENRTQEITQISQALKAVAKDFNCPVIALSQLNRSLENRADKRPVNSDLRESGAIEQDADVIMFIYRDEVYNEDTAEKGIAEIIIGKQRNGPIGTCRLAFQGRYSRFENLAHYNGEESSRFEY